MESEQAYFVRRADWGVDRVALRAVRDLVFVEEQGVPLALEHDDEDATAFHLLAEDRDGSTIGTGRLLATGQIGRMAVVPRWRNRGVGRALLSALLAEAEARGIAPFLNAQHTAVRFYAGFGFEATGPEFLEAGIRHRRMERRHTPAGG